MKINRTILTALLTICAGAGAYGAHIGFMMPSGAKQDSTVDVIIGGQAFWGVREAYISGKGVTVEKVEFVPGLPNPDGKQNRYISQVLRLYHQGKPNTVKLPESTEGWRKHSYYEKLYDLTDCQRDILYRFLYVPRNSLQASPAISGRAIVTLRIAKDAPIGEREFRLIARNGSLSNPLKFFVGSDPEFREPFFRHPSVPKTAGYTKVTVPCAINGQITPGETDTYEFELKKGEQITFKLLGRFFNPFIGDGVPGHFQPVLEIFDSKKKSLAYADDYYFDPDPVLTFTAPESAVYTLKVRDALYRGREDFVYRIHAFAGSLPLPDAPAPEIGNIPVKDMGDLKLDSPLQFPLIVKHTLKTPRGNDYRIKLKKDEEVVLEVFARRLGLPPDTVIKVSDSSGKLLTYNDDFDRPKFGTILHNSADSLIYFKAPSDGEYIVNVSDTAKAYGDAYRYYLRIDQLRTRFAVYAAPSYLGLNQNSAAVLKLQTERFDRFDGEIKLRVVQPSNVTIAGSNIIPANCNSAYITLTATKWEKNRPIHNLVLEASANGFKTTVIPGNEATQAFAYTHINPAKTFPVRVLRQTQKVDWKKLPAGGIVLKNQPVTLTAAMLYGRLPENTPMKLEVYGELPKWLKITQAPTAKVKYTKDAKKRNIVKLPDLTVTLKAEKLTENHSDNVVFQLVWTTTSKPDKNGKVRQYTNRLLLPAVHIKGEKN